MLTKEECEKALEHFEKCYWNQDCSYGAMSRVRKDLDILNKLIHEHFSNPPLKYEEIEEEKWYWHKKMNGWMKIINKDVSTSNVPIMENENTYVYFEENCFYRKKV